MHLWILFVCAYNNSHYNKLPLRQRTHAHTGALITHTCTGSLGWKIKYEISAAGTVGH